MQITVTVPTKDDITFYTLGPINGDPEGIAQVRAEWRGLRSPTVDVKGKDIGEAEENLYQSIVKLVQGLSDQTGE